VPGTYIGGLVRIYSSSGVLVMSGDWSYADAFPGDVAGCEWNDYYDPANTPQYSYYYSKGRVKLYNGNGYNYYDCNASPNAYFTEKRMFTRRIEIQCITQLLKVLLFPACKPRRGCQCIRTGYFTIFFATSILSFQ
jgi:hypothetical protein